MKTDFTIAHVPKDAVPLWEAVGWTVCGDFAGTHHDAFNTVLMRRDAEPEQEAAQ
jgi:hypothetical protein